MIQIIPTLFSTTEKEYKERLSKLRSNDVFEEGWVQLDLMDNKFVPKLGVSIDVIKKNRPPFKIEAQLMVVDPREWISGLVDLKVERIVFPVEIDKDIKGLISEIVNNNIQVGLSINPDTDLGKLDPYLELLDAVLIMGVNPGLEQQKLNPNTFERVRTLKEKNPALIVGVDGGVNDVNIRELSDAGVDYVAVGSFLFKGDPEEGLEILWEKINAT